MLQNPTAAISNEKMLKLHIIGSAPKHALAAINKRNSLLVNSFMQLPYAVSIVGSFLESRRRPKAK
jgi:hypothetical protein